MSNMSNLSLCQKEYMEKLMNEENEWDNKISAEVKEGPADLYQDGQSESSTEEDEKA